MYTDNSIYRLSMSPSYDGLIDDSCDADCTGGKHFGTSDGWPNSTFTVTVVETDSTADQTGCNWNGGTLSDLLSAACVVSTTTFDFTTTYVCGNGTIEGAEACDDGNADAGDGCSDTCTIEAGWSCTGEPSACTEDSGPPTPDESSTNTAQAIDRYRESQELWHSWLALIGCGALFFFLSFYEKK